MPNTPAPRNVLGTTELRTVSVDALDALQVHAAAWDALAQHTHPQVPVFGYHWTRTFLAQRLRPRERWRCVFAYRGRELVGVLPLVVSPHPLLGMRAPRLRTATDLHALLGGPVLAHDTQRAATANTLVAEHLRAEPGCSSLTFERLIDGTDYASILDEVNLPHLALKRPSGVEGCYLDTRGSYERHLESLGSKTRARLRAAERRLARTGRVRHQIIDGRDDLPDALEAFIALEGSGWKQRSGTAIACDPDDRVFYESLCRAFAPVRGMQIHMLRLDGELLAAELAFRFGRKLTIQKLAYNEAHAKVSPGHLLWRRTVEMAYADPTIDAVDTLTTDAIRMRWRAIPYTYIDRVLYPRTLVARVTAHWPALVRSRAASHVRRWHVALADRAP